MQVLKTILTFVAVLAGLGVLYYGISVYDKNAGREYELRQKEVERLAQNDSLKSANANIQADNDRLRQDLTDLAGAKEHIKQVYTDKTKKDITKPASEQGKILKELIEK